MTEVPGEPVLSARQYRELADQLGMPRKMVSPSRLRMLLLLVARGGSVRGANLTIPQRSAASMMQADGLAEWKAPSNRKRTGAQNLDDWILDITQKGLDVVEKARACCGATKDTGMAP